LKSWAKKSISQMKRLNTEIRRYLLGIVVLACGALAGCSGVPLWTMARMATINPGDIITGDASQYVLAVNVDAGVNANLTSTDVPRIDIESFTNVPGDWAPFSGVLEFERVQEAPASLGLAAPTQGRRWIIYRLSAAGKAKHAAFLQYIDEFRKRPNPKGGGRMQFGLELDFAATILRESKDQNVDLWLRLKTRDGFFRLWSGNAQSLARKS
jgi:hypothetical protein